MPVSGIDPAWWVALIGLPLLVGAALVARVLEITPGDLGLRRPRAPVFDIIIMTVGVSLGLLLSVLLGPQMALPGDPGPIVFLLAAGPFVAFLEELIFRGLLQQVAAIRSPRLAIFIPNALYAAMYIGSGYGLAAVTMGAVGILFSAFVGRSGSLWGVVGAHLLMRLVIQFDPGF
jgi:membrane protease YdiL (CAAX protease family)